jgi:hypothetical protein
MRAMFEIVGVECAGIAITDLRCLIDMRGIKAMGGKILHLQAADEQADVAPERRGHRLGVDLDSPEVRRLCDEVQDDGGGHRGRFPSAMNGGAGAPGRVAGAGPCRSRCRWACAPRRG